MGDPLSQLILALIVLLFCIKNVMDVNWDWIQILAGILGGIETSDVDRKKEGEGRREMGKRSGEGWRRREEE